MVVAVVVDAREAGVAVVVVLVVVMVVVVSVVAVVVVAAAAVVVFSIRSHLIATEKAFGFVLAATSFPPARDP